MYSLKNVLRTLLPCLLFASCEQDLIDQPAARPADKLVPASIDYHEETGSLSHLVYRSKFQYNADGQLAQVTDSLLAPASGRLSSWVNFYYKDGKLAEIVLWPAGDPRIPYDPRTDTKASRFYFTYEGDVVNTRQVVGGEQKGTFSFKTDENGFPVRKNVQYGSLFLDAVGNVDFVAANNAAKAGKALGGWKVLDQQFDQNRNIFRNSKEFQMLGVILAAYDWNMVTSLVPYLGILTTNNEISKTLCYDSAADSCRTSGTVVSETASVNAEGLPTRRVAQVMVMGRYDFKVQYQMNAQ